MKGEEGDFGWRILHSSDIYLGLSLPQILPVMNEICASYLGWGFSQK